MRERDPHGLVGRRLPSLALASVDGEPVAFDRVARGWVAYYFYPGVDASAAAGDAGSRVQDAAQHRAFGERREQLATAGVEIVGVSSEHKLAQRETVLANYIGHTMLADPGLALAAELGLPTLATDGHSCYRRLTLLTRDGVVAWVFYPLTDVRRTPSQILTWLRLNDDGEADADARRGRHGGRGGAAPRLRSLPRL